MAVIASAPSMLDDDGFAIFPISCGDDFSVICCHDGGTFWYPKINPIMALKAEVSIEIFEDGISLGGTKPFGNRIVPDERDYERVGLWVVKNRLGQRVCDCLCTGGGNGGCDGTDG